MFPERLERPIHDSRGFTLIEVLVVLVLTAIAGSLLIPYVRSASEGSARQMEMLRDAMVLQEEMEKATALYRQMAEENSGGSFLTAFLTSLNPENGVAIDTATRFIIFKKNPETGTYEVETNTETEQMGSHLMLVLRRGDQRVQSLFSDAE